MIHEPRPMRRVVIESPYRSDDPKVRDTYRRYLDAALRDCMIRGQAPFASHGLYTRSGVLDDDQIAERVLGIRAGFAWRTSETLTAVYGNFGISYGMYEGIQHALNVNSRIEFRFLLKFEGITSCTALFEEHPRLWGILQVP